MPNLWIINGPFYIWFASITVKPMIVGLTRMEGRRYFETKMVSIRSSTSRHSG